MDDQRRGDVVEDAFPFAPEVFVEKTGVEIWLPELEVYSQGSTLAEAKDDLVEAALDFASGVLRLHRRPFVVQVRIQNADLHLMRQGLETQRHVRSVKTSYSRQRSNDHAAAKRQSRRFCRHVRPSGAGPATHNGRPRIATPAGGAV